VSDGRIVLGIDPGTAIMGYGVVRQAEGGYSVLAFGAITTPSTLSMPSRLHELHCGVVDLIQRYRPAEMAVEALFFNKNVRSALAVGQARGVALLAAAQGGQAVSEYTPLQVKQAITGYGRAKKEQIQRMLQILLNIDFVPEPDDAADALAIAVCHLHYSELSRAIAERSQASEVIP
jgi:crossover junction endodeoxyribonuclease RuvC